MSDLHSFRPNLVRKLPVTWGFDNQAVGRIDAGVPMIQSTSIRIEVIACSAVSKRDRSATT